MLLTNRAGNCRLVRNARRYPAPLAAGQTNSKPLVWLNGLSDRFPSPNRCDWKNVRFTQNKTRSAEQNGRQMTESSHTCEGIPSRPSFGVIDFEQWAGDGSATGEVARADSQPRLCFDP